MLLHSVSLTERIVPNLESKQPSANHRPENRRKSSDNANSTGMGLDFWSILNRRPSKDFGEISCNCLKTLTGSTPFRFHAKGADFVKPSAFAKDFAEEKFSAIQLFKEGETKKPFSRFNSASNAENFFMPAPWPGMEFGTAIF